MPSQGDSRESKNDEVQRKMAEQLAERVGTSPEEIERGVKTFIERSSESLGGADTRPPYRRAIWYDRFFGIIQNRQIDKFSLEFLKLNIAQTRSEAYKLRSGLRFLGLIDKKGNSTSRLDGLRVTGDKFKKNLADVIRNAYSDLFRTIIVETARVENVVNFMIERYGYSKPLAEQATALLSYFCLRAEIPISQELSAFKPRTRVSKRKAVSKRPKKRPRGAEPELEYARLPEEALARFTLKDVGYVDIKDKDTYLLAKAYLTLLSKKLGIADEEEL